jgi:prepilin-type N-terminal cleavage/methylation domain-containing protein
VIILTTIWKEQLPLVNHKRGFTLIELLVVVAIIGILAAVGVVAYSGYTSTAKHKVTMKNFDLVSKFIQTTVMRCNIEGGKIQLSNNNVIDCNSSNSASSIRQIGDVFTNFFLEQGFKNPYNSKIPAIIRSGGSEQVGQLRLDDTPCGGSNPESSRRMLLWVKTEKTRTNKYIELLDWCN